jgi:hypothetical protein
MTVPPNALVNAANPQIALRIANLVNEWFRNVVLFCMSLILIGGFLLLCLLARWFSSQMPFAALAKYRAHPVRHEMRPLHLLQNKG